MQTLDLVETFPERLHVEVLAACGRHPERLADQIRRFRPSLVAVSDPASLPRLRDALGSPHGGDGSALGVRIEAGETALVEAAAHPGVDLVAVLTVGLAGLDPALAALEAGKAVALANKEVLVAGGDLIPAPDLVASGRLLPVDSEHSALWQALLGERPAHVRRLWLTASGGPFWGWPSERLEQVTPEQALAHPTWRMGPRVTIDSATLMNKGFEVIEAHHLFGAPYDAIRIAVHRQSVVHSLVEFVDGSLKAQLSNPDMRLPLLFALSHPERWAFERVPRLFDTADGAPLSLTFEALDAGHEPRAVALARRAARAGGTFPAVLSAADEVAVEAFLAGKMPFHRLLDVVETLLERHEPPRGPLSLEAVKAADAWARGEARRVARL